MHQYSLEFKRQDAFLEEDYVISDCNAYVANLIFNFPVRWGVDPYPRTLLIIGPKSSGKTHLANIWAAKANAKFASGEEISTFNNSNVIIDDIENYAEKDLFHLFNQAHEDAKYMLITASSKPEFSLADLQSRLNAVLRVHIDLPDEHMIKILLIKGFSNRSIKVGVEVLDYLSLRITRDFSSIATLIEQLDSVALSAKRKITIPLIKELGI
jgi:chromosomal replication initiation ATPase DnaA